jgi:hypothetical protein
VHFLDEVPQHSLGNIEVRDNTVFQWPDGDDISRRPADHALCFEADRYYLAGVGIESYDRGFIQNNSATSDVHERIGSAEVHGHVAAKKGHSVAHLEREPSLRSTDVLV